jgi:hypothetical protein
MLISRIRKFQVIFTTLLMLGSSFAKANWEFIQRSDPFEDHDTSFVYPDDASYSSDNELTISVRCEVDGLNLLLSHSYMVGDSDGETLAVLRVDKHDAIGPIYFTLQGNSQSWMPLRHVNDAVNQMKRGESIVVRITDPSDDEQLFEDVSLTGFADAVERLTCF